MRLGGRFACPEQAEWWFEYGPTPQYGQRTASNRSAVPPLAERGDLVVRTDVDGLAYRTTHYYRFVVRYPDGEIQAGSGGFVRMNPAPLRPPQRVSLEWSHRPTPARTILDQIAVLDAPAGALATVSCTGSRLCKLFEKKIVIGRRPTTFKNWRVRAPGFIIVGVSGRGGPTTTTIRPRPHRGPTSETSCGGYPVVLATRCLGVSLSSVGQHVRSLTVSNVVRGSRVQIACRGGGCPPSDFSEVIRRSSGSPYAQLALAGYTRMRPGATLRIFISRAQTYGLERTFNVTRRTVNGSPYRCLHAPARCASCAARRQFPSMWVDPDAARRATHGLDRQTNHRCAGLRPGNQARRQRERALGAGSGRSPRNSPSNAPHE